MSNMDIIFMSYVEQNLDVQEDHFPAFGFKGGEKSPQAKVDKILIYTLGCKFLGWKKASCWEGKWKQIFKVISVL